jgi:hypothetical protein
MVTDNLLNLSRYVPDGYRQRCACSYEIKANTYKQYYDYLSLRYLRLLSVVWDIENFITSQNEREDLLREWQNTTWPLPKVLRMQAIRAKQLRNIYSCYMHAWRQKRVRNLSFPGQNLPPRFFDFCLIFAPTCSAHVSVWKAHEAQGIPSTPRRKYKDPSHIHVTCVLAKDFRHNANASKRTARFEKNNDAPPHV